MSIKPFREQCRCDNKGRYDAKCPTPVDRRPIQVCYRVLMGVALTLAYCPSQQVVSSPVRDRSITRRLITISYMITVRFRSWGTKLLMEVFQIHSSLRSYNCNGKSVFNALQSLCFEHKFPAVEGSTYFSHYFILLISVYYKTLLSCCSYMYLSLAIYTSISN